MILRFASGMALAFGLLILFGYLHALGKGPWASPRARHLRAMKDRTEVPAMVEPTMIPAIAALPRRLPLSEREPIERRAVVVEGYVQRIFRAVDGDLHLDVSESSPGEEGKIRDYLITEITPSWRRGSEGWRVDRLHEKLRPRRGSLTSWEGGPRRARLTGWLLYDHPHEGRKRRAGRSMALSAWEIHPVTHIELWDEARSTFVEYAR